MSFWDTSALVPLCINEDRSVIAGQLWRRFKDHHVWSETSVEIVSALARRWRENVISEPERLLGEKRLFAIESQWVVVEPDKRLTEVARSFPIIHGLRSLDSLQVASALIWCKEFPKNKDFVSADHRLLIAAEAVGFTVHDLS